MQNELGLKPEAETLALAQAISQRTRLAEEPHWLETQPAAAASFLRAGTDQLPLVGRKAERGELLRLIGPVYTSCGGVILLEGEAGMSKTRFPPHRQYRPRRIRLPYHFVV